MTLSRDFREFVEFLNANRVSYLLVGGYAVAVHGHPRYTKDLDIWIEAERENARRLMGALSQFGFGEVGLTEADFLEPERVIQMGLPPNRIDVLTSIPGVTFGECYQHRVNVEMDGVPVPCIGREDLIQAKRAARRPQYLADVHSLLGKRGRRTSSS